MLGINHLNVLPTRANSNEVAKNQKLHAGGQNIAANSSQLGPSSAGVGPYERTERTEIGGSVGQVLDAGVDYTYHLLFTRPY